MPFPKTITYTATGFTKTAMSFDHVYHDDKWWVTWHQGYQFVDNENIPLTGIQNKYAVKGEISETDLRANHPEIWSALSALWIFMENQIKAQEDL